MGVRENSLEVDRREEGGGGKRSQGRARGEMFEPRDIPIRVTFSFL